jgi:hypothetical protein
MFGHALADGLADLFVEYEYVVTRRVAVSQNHVPCNADGPRLKWTAFVELIEFLPKRPSHFLKQIFRVLEIHDMSQDVPPDRRLNRYETAQEIPFLHVIHVASIYVFIDFDGYFV